jgi:hypothetical protein
MSDYDDALSRARHLILCAACRMPLGDAPGYFTSTATYHKACAEPLIDAEARTHSNPDMRELLSYNRGLLPA